MAAELIERIRRGYAAWNEDDLTGTLELLAADVEWQTSASFPGTAPLYRGHAGFREFWRDLHEPWERVRVEIESFEQEQAVAIMRIRFHGTSKGSGVDVDLPWFQVIEVVDGLVQRSALDRDVGGALEALDLSDTFPEF